MEVKPGYKQTEVGVIPEEWDVSTVGREYEIKLGKMLDSEKNVGVPKPYLGNRAVQWDRIDITDLPTVPMSRSDIERFRLRKGDLLVCEGGEVGRAAIWEAPIEECYYQKALHRLRPLRSFNSYVMAAFLRRWSDCGLLANYVTQTSIAHLPREKFMEVPMPVPPPPEQRDIAATLSDVDGLLGGLDRLIAKRRDLKQAVMQQLLTGQIRLPSFHGEWEVKRLGDVLVRLANGALYQPTNSTGLPVTRIETIAEGTIDMSRVGYGARTSELEEYRMLPGDILFSHINSVDHIGKVAMYSGEPPLYHGMNLLLLRAGSSLDSQFLFYWLGSHKGRNKAVSLARQAVSQASINTSDLKRVEIPLPTLPEQTAIAEVLTDMDAELAALEQRREKTRALKQAMMQELLTGRIRLV